MRGLSCPAPEPGPPPFLLNTSNRIFGGSKSRICAILIRILGAHLEDCAFAGLRRKMRRICTIVAFAVLLATPGMANLLTNGSFENGIFTPSPIPTYNGGDPLFVGSTAMTGWTVVDNNGLTSSTNQSIAWLPTGSYGLFAQNGGDFLDLTGYFEAAQNG